MSTDFFHGRKLVIATQHQKEQVIAPLFKEELGVVPMVLPGFNTDQFGTFTREVERTQDPLATARLKIEKALTLSGETLGIASEGSFGLHPQIGFVPADEELLLLLDTENKIEIFASKISASTNYAQRSVTDWEEAKNFAEEAGFPSHGVIIRNESSLQKGIIDWKELQRIFEQLKAASSAIQIETDMRAQFNPTRMKVIEETTRLLIDKINSVCPSCHLPGYSISERVPGLPCRLCGNPSSHTLRLIYECVYCHHQSTVFFPEGEHCDPMYCNECNP
jgi:hypothetical protein